jgi:hypothetical protein
LNHAPSLRLWTKMDAKPCNPMHHPTANSNTCKPGAKAAPVANRELSDSAHWKNAALRFQGGQYNLNYG